MYLHVSIKGFNGKLKKKTDRKSIVLSRGELVKFEIHTFKNLEKVFSPTLTK